MVYKKDGQLYAHYPQTSSLSFGEVDPFQKLLDNIIREPFMLLHEAHMEFEKLVSQQSQFCKDLKTQIDKQLTHIHTKEFIKQSETNMVKKIEDIKACAKTHIVISGSDDKIKSEIDLEVKKTVEVLEKEYMDNLAELKKNSELKKNAEPSSAFGQINNIL